MLAILFWSNTSVFAQTDDAIAPASPAALEFAQTMQAGRQLRAFMRGIATHTVTIQGTVAKYGADKVTPVLERNIEEEAIKHDAEWANNLALSYEEYLTDDELRSLAKNTAQSPFVPKLKEVMPQAGASMKRRSEALVTAAATQVVMVTFRQFTTGDPPK